MRTTSWRTALAPIAVAALLGITLIAVQSGITRSSAAAADASEPLSGRDATVILGKNMTVDLGMDPARAFEELDFLVLGAAYSRLVKFPTMPDGTLDFSTLEGDLAEDFSMSEDAKTFTFTIKDDATFASGNKVTSEDVRFSYERLKNVQGVPAFLAAGIEAIEAPDESTVVITLTDPNPGFLKQLTGANFAVLDSEVVKANGGSDAADASTSDTAEAFLSSESAGSGPFKMVSYDREQRLVLQRVDDYWAGPPAEIEQFIVQHMPEPDLQAAALERGDIDITWNLIGQPDLIDRLAGAGFVLEKKPTMEWYTLFFTADPANSEAIANEKVQLALKLAIDYEGLKQVCPVGSTRMGPAPEFIGGLPESELLTEDLDRARALLEEAGYADGFDVTHTGFRIGGVCPTHEALATKIAADWDRIGVRSTLDFREFEQAWTQIQSGDTQVSYAGWIADYPDPANYTQYALPVTSLADFARFGIGGPAVDSPNFPSFDQLVTAGEQMNAELDDAKRLELVRQAEHLALEASAVYPILVLDTAVMATPSLDGFNYNLLYKFDPYQFGRE